MCICRRRRHHRKSNECRAAAKLYRVFFFQRTVPIAEKSSQRYNSLECICFHCLVISNLGTVEHIVI